MGDGGEAIRLGKDGGWEGCSTSVDSEPMESCSPLPSVSGLLGEGRRVREVSSRSSSGMIKVGGSELTQI